MLSAHELCQTRLCQAVNCANEAEPGWPLCRWCEARRGRGWDIKLHEVEQPALPDPETMLLCNRCSTWKPDAEFSRRGDEPKRRYHRFECRACTTLTKRAYRERMTPEQRERDLARDRNRKRTARNAQAAS